VRLIRPGEYRRMRWKNGVGETAEIAVRPEGAALDQFDWRVSMARIEAPGPFSAFPGVDRTLTVLDGEGFRLTVDGRPAVELTPASAPFAFSGESPASATLLGGAVTDLNVMTRRSRLWHRVRRFAPGEQLSLETTGDTSVVFCSRGSLRVSAGRAVAELGERDSLLIERPVVELEIAADAGGTVLLIEIGRN
jgi:environmental stress-induced protein Ves